MPELSVVALPAQRAQKRGPWSEDELVELVGLVRTGSDAVAAADALGRPRTTVWKQLRLMLPPEERACPSYLVVTALARHLEEEGFDWRATMLRVAPPRPIQHVERAGVDGLSDDHVVAAAYALLTVDRWEDRALLEELWPVVRARELVWRVADRRRRFLVQAGMAVVEAERAAYAWLEGVDDLGTPLAWGSWV